MWSTPFDESMLFQPDGIVILCTEKNWRMNCSTYLKRMGSIGPEKNQWIIFGGMTVWERNAIVFADIKDMPEQALSNVATETLTNMGSIVIIPNAHSSAQSLSLKLEMKNCCFPFLGLRGEANDICQQ